MRRPTLAQGAAIVAALVCLLAFVSAVRSADPSDCYPIPVTAYTPSGIAGCIHYGIGTASTWGGPGAARNDCVWPWKGCQTVTVRSLDTGFAIIVTPTMFCDCWQRPGPNGETLRLIDLDPGMVEQLGLDARLGLWRVEVQPVGMPDTAMAP